MFFSQFQCWVQDLSVFFVFFVTLTCFPAIQAGVEKASSSFPIPGLYEMVAADV